MKLFFKILISLFILVFGHTCQVSANSYKGIVFCDDVFAKQESLLSECFTKNEISKTYFFERNFVDYWEKYCVDEAKAEDLAEGADELAVTIKNSLKSRIANETGLELKYSDDEIKAIVQNGKKLNFPDNEIEDIIFNGCRESKAFTAEELISQTNYWSIVKQRGYPNLLIVCLNMKNSVM